MPIGAVPTWLNGRHYHRFLFRREAATRGEKEVERECDGAGVDCSGY